MKLTAVLLKCSARAIGRVTSRWRLFLFRVKAGFLNKCLDIGPGTTLSVPVRSGGFGTLKIGNRNHFGYRPAPRFGSGEILLQVRSTESVIIIGSNNHFSNNVSLIAKLRISIGDDCLIGDQVTIVDADFHGIHPETRRTSPGQTAPVVIGNNVWLGSRAVVLKGVTIGDNSVIGAMSLVTRSIPPNCIAAGNPDRVIREFGAT